LPTLGEEILVLRFTGMGVSDVGCVRGHNEDSGFLGPYLAVVADGVGGAAAGEIASATAVYVMAALALAEPRPDPGHLLAEAIVEARALLVTGVTADPSRAGMATTLTAIATDGRRVVLGHLGDSRAYLFRDLALTRISRDHTWVQTMIDQGELSPDAARTHPWRNVVMRSLHGQPLAADSLPDILELNAHVGDRFLLCSDGLTDLVDEQRIAVVMQLADPHSAAARLVADALEAGGADNVTCLVFDMVDGPEVVGDGLLLGAVSDPTNIVDAAAVRPTHPGLTAHS